MADITRLLDLSHDEVSIVAHELCDALQPLHAVHLSSAAKGLRAAMREQIDLLRQRHAVAVAFAGLCGMGCAELPLATTLFLGKVHKKPASLAHWRTFGMLLGCGSLPRLETLAVHGSSDEGVFSGSSIEHLNIAVDDSGDKGGVFFLAEGLCRGGGLPVLHTLNLSMNPFGDAGLAALLPALLQLPMLKLLYLAYTKITDEGLASLVAQPLKSLERLGLSGNHINDAGCAKLASALRGGALPALNTLNLKGNRASQKATDAVLDARKGLTLNPVSAVTW